MYIIPSLVEDRGFPPLEDDDGDPFDEGDEKGVVLAAVLSSESLIRLLFDREGVTVFGLTTMLLLSTLLLALELDCGASVSAVNAWYDDAVFFLLLLLEDLFFSLA